IFAVQVLHGRIENIFSQYDMSFGIRNDRTDIWVNGYGFCLPGDAQITTPEGLLSIESLAHVSKGVNPIQVRIGIHTYQAIAFVTGNKELWEVVFEDGRILHASGDHLLWTMDASSIHGFTWKPVCTLTEDNYVACDEPTLRQYYSDLWENNKHKCKFNAGFFTSRVISVSNLNQIVPMYDLSVSSNFH